jgi:hypothetical protein
VTGHDRLPHSLADQLIAGSHHAWGTWSRIARVEMAAPRHAATKATNSAHRVPAEWLPGATADSGANNPRFIVTSLKRAEAQAPYLWEAIYCGRGEMENRIKERQLGLFADRTSTATMRANQLRLWFASMADVLLCALRRIGLAQTQFVAATCATIRLKLLKIGAWVRISVRRVEIAMASACPYRHEFAVAHALLGKAAR